MFKCYKCEKTFDKSKTKIVCMEDYYATSLFPTKNYYPMPVCPFCESEDIEELNEDESIS